MFLSVFRYKFKSVSHLLYSNSPLFCGMKMLKLRVFFYQISSSIQPFFSARSLALWSGSPPQLLEFLALKNIVVPYVILKHVVPLKKKSKGATNQSQFSWCIPTVCAVAVAC